MLSISENILSFIAAFGVLPGILLSFLVYSYPKSDKSVNKFLAPYIACLTIIMSGPFFLQLISWKHSFFIVPFPLLAGPLLYFYIRSFKETIARTKAFPHLVLFIIFKTAFKKFTGFKPTEYRDKQKNVAA